MVLRGVNNNIDKVWSFITEYRKHRRRNRSRFSLLMLEHGEYYFNDYSMDFLPPPSPMRLPAREGHLACSTNQGGAIGISKRRAQRGRLKLCSRGLLFEPADEHEPCLRFHFSDMIERLDSDVGIESNILQIEEDSKRRTKSISSFCKSSSSISARIISVDSVDVFAFCINAIVEIDGGERPAPYRVIQLDDNLEPNMKTFGFILLHTDIGNFLPLLYFLLDTAMEVKDKGLSQEASLLHPILAERFGSCLSRFNAVHLVDFREVLQFPHPLRVMRVTPLLKAPGGLMVTNHHMYFQPAEVNNVEGHMLSVGLSTISRISKICHLLQQTGLELVGNEGNGETIVLTLAFMSEAERDAVYLNIINQRGISKKVLEHADLRKTLLSWQRYLCHLNAAAGRSINDLSLYPVFPWIICDYTSPTLDLNNPSTYRDLSKPIGALNKERLDYFKSRMASLPSFDENCSESEGMTPPFLYGTHFSTPGYVLFYLVRSAPENGRFDSADRLFLGMQRTWESILTNHVDLKELIPEFYAGDGSFLLNSSGLDLGVCQGGECVGDVVLPPWANRSPKAFIQGCRNALEGDYVSNRLHQWIDLIFGSKQRGQAALEGTVDMKANRSDEEQNALEVQISEFGQCPKQLFVTSHPSRDNVGSPVGLTEDNRSQANDREPLSHSKNLPFPGFESTMHQSKSSFDGWDGAKGAARSPSHQPDPSSATTPPPPPPPPVIYTERVESPSPKLGIGGLLKRGLVLTHKTLVGSSSTGPSSSRTGNGGNLRSSESRSGGGTTQQSKSVQVVNIVTSGGATSGSEGLRTGAVRVPSNTRSHSLHAHTSRPVASPPPPRQLSEMTYRDPEIHFLPSNSEPNLLACITMHGDRITGISTQCTRGMDDDSNRTFLAVCTSSQDGTLKLSHLQREISGEVTAMTKRCFNRIQNNSRLIHVDSNQGSIAISGGWDNSITTYSVTAARVLFQLPNAHDDGVAVMEMHEDPKGDVPRLLVTGGWDAAVRLWKVTPSGGIVTPPEVEWFDLDTPVMAVTIDSTGDIVAAVSEGGQLGVWDARTGETVATSQVIQRGPIIGLKWGFHDNGTCLVIASASGVVSKVTLMGSLLSSMTVVSKPDNTSADLKHQSNTIVSFHSDGRTAFVGCSDGSVAVLQSSNDSGKGFQQVMSIQAFCPPSKMSCLEVSNNGSTLLCGCTTGILKVWSIDRNGD